MHADDVRRDATPPSHPLATRQATAEAHFELLGSGRGLNFPVCVSPHVHVAARTTAGVVPAGPRGRLVSALILPVWSCAHPFGRGAGVAGRDPSDLLGGL